jgi:cytochrome c oxidase subunit 1
LVSRSSRGIYRIVALGIASEVIATNARKPIFGYRAMIMSIIAIGFLRLLWGITLFVSGMNPFCSVFTLQHY